MTLIPEDVKIVGFTVAHLVLGALLALLLVGLCALVTGMAHRRELDAALAAREGALADRDAALAQHAALVSQLVRLAHTWDMEAATRPTAPAAVQRRCAAELLTHLDEAQP